MSEATPGYIQVAPDSTGKAVRNIAVDVVQTDGTTATVHMQVVALADEDGRLLRPDDDRWDALLAAVTRTNTLLEMIAETLG